MYCCCWKQEQAVSLADRRAYLDHEHGVEGPLLLLQHPGKQHILVHFLMLLVLHGVADFQAVRCCCCCVCGECMLPPCVCVVDVSESAWKSSWPPIGLQKETRRFLPTVTCLTSGQEERNLSIACFLCYCSVVLHIWSSSARMCLVRGEVCFSKDEPV